MFAVALSQSFTTATLIWSGLVSLQLLLVTADYEVFTAGSVWKFDDSGQDLISSGFHTLGFLDDNFKSGPTPIGYGATTFPTIASFGSDPLAKPITTYFRKSFQVLDELSTTANLTVSVNYAHGVRCFLNGDNLFRKNLPVTTLTSLTTANSAISKPTVLAQYSIIPVFSKLKLGLNVVACDVHLFSPASSVMRFDMGLIAGGVPPPSPSPSVSPTISDTPTRTPSQSRGASASRTSSPSMSPPAACSCDCRTLTCCDSTQTNACLSGRDSSSKGSKSASSGSNGGAVAAGILVPLIVIGIGYGYYRYRSHKKTLVTKKIDWKTPASMTNTDIDPFSIVSNPLDSAGKAKRNSPTISREDLINELRTIRLDGFGGVSTQRVSSQRVPRRSSKKKNRRSRRYSS
jgi:hypothetical protein